MKVRNSFILKSFKSQNEANVWAKKSLGRGNYSVIESKNYGSKIYNVIKSDQTTNPDLISSKTADGEETIYPRPGGESIESRNKRAEAYMKKKSGVQEQEQEQEQEQKSTPGQKPEMSPAERRQFRRNQAMIFAMQAKINQRKRLGKPAIVIRSTVGGRVLDADLYDSIIEPDNLNQSSIDSVVKSIIREMKKSGVIKSSNEEEPEQKPKNIRKLKRNTTTKSTDDEDEDAARSAMADFLKHLSEEGGDADNVDEKIMRKQRGRQSPSNPKNKGDGKFGRDKWVTLDTKGEEKPAGKNKKRLGQ
jgi:hypothetical protein